MERETAQRSVRIGPAGWSYRDWIGPVYPRGSETDQLLTIARHFNCVELNSSFYRVPGSRLVESWNRRLAEIPGFSLSVKVLQRITHERGGDRESVSSFMRAFDPMIERGLVGAFLLQFPWSFRNRPENRDYVQRLGSLFRAVPTAIELRHGSWNVPGTLELLAGCGLAFCNIDQPLIGDSLPPTAHVTDARLGYIRLHGRNRKNWFNEAAGRDERYDYLYGERELDEWRRRAKSIIGAVQNLFIITNNHFRGQALVNAFQLKSMLEGRPVPIMHELVRAYPVLGRIAAGETRRGTLL